MNVFEFSSKTNFKLKEKNQCTAPTKCKNPQDCPESKKRYTAFCPCRQDTV